MTTQWYESPYHIFVEKYQRIHRDIVSLEEIKKTSETSLVTVCGGVALVRAKPSTRICVRLCDEIHLKTSTIEEGVILLNKQLNRLKFLWLRQLEDEQDEGEGLEEFKAVTGTRTIRSNDTTDSADYETDANANPKEVLYFEPYEYFK